MSEEMTEKAYTAASDSVSKAHREAVVKAKALIEKAKADALTKLGS